MKNLLETIINCKNRCANISINRPLVELFIDNLYQFFFNNQETDAAKLEFRLELLSYDFREILMTLNLTDQKEELLSKQFFNRLNAVYKKCLKDAEAIYTLDPAAKNITEVFIAYPGFFAIYVYRISHLVYEFDLHLIARVISEYAHSKTGIDIHPGASIGEYFAIDHGTGTVIGETCIIGNHVTIFQGVTLGAIVVDKKPKDKRHPTIEDNVIIYAGATILGGNTTVGHDSIIGGNVWLTRSVTSYSLVIQENKITVLDKNNSTYLIDFVI